MRRLSTRRRRSATVCSRRAQSRTARSILSGSSLEAASADSRRSLALASPPSLSTRSLTSSTLTRSHVSTEHVVEGASELGVVVAGQNPDRQVLIVQVHRGVPCLLGHPCRVRVGRAPRRERPAWC